MALTASIIDVSALASVIAASIIAGAGLTTAFSVVIVCATRAAEARRSQKGIASAVYGAMATLAAMLCVGLVVFGINIMVSK